MWLTKLLPRRRLQAHESWPCLLRVRKKLTVRYARLRVLAKRLQHAASSRLPHLETAAVSLRCFGAVPWASARDFGVGATRLQLDSKILWCRRLNMAQLHSGYHSSKSWLTTPVFFRLVRLEPGTITMCRAYTESYTCNPAA